MTIYQAVGKVYGESLYTWHTYKSSTPTKLATTRGNRSVVLRKGSRFGVRSATSKKGYKRVIVRELGPSIMFSLSDRKANNLMNKGRAG